MKPYYLSLLPLFISFFSSAQCDRHRDSLALVYFYDATFGPNWTTKWDLNETIDNWHGLDLNDAGCVRGIELIDNNLFGSIPAEFYELVELEYLNLSGNYLGGSLSGRIEALSKLSYLALEANEFTGEIPPELGKLNKLRLLNLSINYLNGEIPSEFGQLTSLKSLYLRHNDFFDEIFPQAFLELDSIVSINIEGNGFIGPIPEELGELEFLDSLSVFLNLMSGCYPEFVCSLERFDARLNSAMPWEGDHTPLCIADMEQIGAPCDDIMTTEPTEIDEDCKCSTLTNHDEFGKLEYKIYPNPSVGELYIDLFHNRAQELKVYDLLGNLVHTQLLVQGKNKIHLDQQVNVMYFLNIEDEIHRLIMKN